MKKNILISTVVLMAGSLIAADSSPKDEVLNATKALSEKANYTWKSTVVVPEDSQFKPGPTDGKTEKGGYTHVNMSTFGDNRAEVVTKGDKTAFTNQDGEWQTPADAENAGGPGRGMARMRNIQTPDKQATELVNTAQEIKKDGNAYSADLTEAGAKTLMAFRGRGGRGPGGGGPGGGEGPAISNAKGTVKFWVNDGVLTKYEIQVKGSMDFNGEARAMDRKTTVEIKDIGTTKVEVPEAAKKKLNPEPAPAAK